MTTPSTRLLLITLFVVALAGCHDDEAATTETAGEATAVPVATTPAVETTPATVPTPTPVNVPSEPTSTPVPSGPPTAVAESTPEAQATPPVAPTAEVVVQAEPTPTLIQQPPVAEGAEEVVDQTGPGTANAPVPEWSVGLEGSDLDVAELRAELLKITDVNDTVLLYRALAGLRLGEALDGAEIEAVHTLSDPAADRSDWQPGYAALVDTAVVLAADAELLSLTTDQARQIDPDQILIFETLDLNYAALLSILDVAILDIPALDPAEFSADGG